MPTLAQVTSRRAVTTIDLGGGVRITVEYYPDRLSAQILRDISQLDKLTNPDGSEVSEEQMLARVDRMAEILATLAASWDLTETEGGPMIALEASRLVQLGLPLLGLVLGHICGATMMGGAKGSPPAKPLNGTSRRRGR